MPAYMAPPLDHEHENEVTLFAQTNFRNQSRKFGIKTDDRRRHMYVVGKTGMGKTTFLEQMVLSDIHAGHGLAYIDPHGDTAEKLLDFIPPHRINDVVYFNPADMENPVGFNILEVADETQKHLVANGLMGVFKKIWPDVWSPRMEYILLNSILALLDFPGSTLLGINRLLSDEEYRGRVVSLIQDPVVKTFWVKEFASFSEKYRTEAVAPVQNKVGQFLSAAIIRNIVAQVKSTIDVREIMDTRKIFIVNLAKGRIGEENSRLLGAMLITRIQLAAMERVDMPEKNRQDFYLYVDEFQNFATESFANILSEARKYRLNLIVAHQYIEQLDELVRAAIFGNVGTLVAFRVGAADATFMEQEFMPRFTPEDLVNLKKFEVYLKLMIDGASSEPFSASTLPPIDLRTGSTEKVVKVSRERYGMTRKTIEEKVIKWAGFGTADTGQKILAEDEVVDEEQREIDERIKQLEASSPNVGEMAQPVGGGGFGGEKKKKKALFQIPCSVCGKMQDLTFEPDWTKPWFCKEDLEKKKAGLLPKGAGKTPASAFRPGADGQMPAASMGASAASSTSLNAAPRMPLSEPADAPAPRVATPTPVSSPAAAPAPKPPTPTVVVPKPAPAPKPAAPAAPPKPPTATPAVSAKPAPRVSAPGPTVKPMSLAALVGATPTPVSTPAAAPTPKFPTPTVVVPKPAPAPKPAAPVVPPKPPTATPAVSAKPAPRVSAPGPTVKPMSLAALVGATPAPAIPKQDVKPAAGATPPEPKAPVIPKPVAAPAPVSAPKPAAPPATPKSPSAPAPKPQPPTPPRATETTSTEQRPPRSPAPPNGSKIESGVAIPMQSHKPRIVISSGNDDEKDVLLVPPAVDVHKRPDPPPAPPLKPRSAPEPFSTPGPDDAAEQDDTGGAGGTLKPGQVIKF